MLIRQNYLTNETVIIAEDRALRPIETRYDSEAGIVAQNGECPFCIDNKHLLSEEIYATQRVRVVSNKFAFVEMPIGHHYVLIDTPNHNERICNFSAEEIAEVFTAAKFMFEREYQPQNLGSRACVQLFKNDGARAGASLNHSHWQITALSAPPSKHKTIMTSFRKYRYNRDFKACYLCDAIKAEQYRVYENEHFTAFCPYAPRYAHEINIASKTHVQSLTELNEAEILAFGDALCQTLRALNTIMPGFNFNILLQEGRFADKTSHLFLAVCPRIGSPAGFELSTGIFTHCEPPERTVELVWEAIQSLGNI